MIDLKLSDFFIFRGISPIFFLEIGFRYYFRSFHLKCLAFTDIL